MLRARKRKCVNDLCRCTANGVLVQLHQLKGHLKTRNATVGRQWASISPSHWSLACMTACVLQNALHSETATATTTTKSVLHMDMLDVVVKTHDGIAICTLLRINVIWHCAKHILFVHDGTWRTQNNSQKHYKSIITSLCRQFDATKSFMASLSISSTPACVMEDVVRRYLTYASATPHTWTFFFLVSNAWACVVSSFFAGCTAIQRALRCHRLQSKRYKYLYKAIRGEQLKLSILRWRITIYMHLRPRGMRYDWRRYHLCRFFIFAQIAVEINLCSILTTKLSLWLWFIVWL